MNCCGTNKLRSLFRLARPKQWVKNGFVLAPLLFTGEFTNPEAVRATLVALILFCVASSSAYVFNDIKDIDDDRKHPLKAVQRPLASGEVSLRSAYCLLFSLYAVLFVAAFYVPDVVGVIGLYLLLNLAYTYKLKHQPVVDIFTIALGFVMRVYAGASAVTVAVSGWMFVTTLCLALYLAGVKRRQELLVNGKDARGVLLQYSPALIERYSEMAATAALVFYGLFVVSVKPGMLITVPLVLFGFFRYWYVVELQNDGESPTDVLLSDVPLQTVIVLWAAGCGWVLWMGS